MGGRRLLLAHAASQAFFVAILWFIPVGGWRHAIVQSGAGWLSAGFFLVGVRRFRPQPVLAWWLIGLGLLLSASGNIVETIFSRCCAITSNPSPADAFWLCLHAGLIAGLGIMVCRRAAGEELGSGTIKTIASALLNLFLGVFAWQYIVWAHNDDSLTLANRFIVTLYPLADLMVVALILRLLLSGGFRNAGLLLVAAAMGWFLVSDVGWSDFIRAHAFPDRWREYLVEASALVARGLLGGVTLIPAAGTIAPAPHGEPLRLGALGWLGIVASVLTAPGVLMLQALLDRLYSVSSF
jgi:hypothetical protein